MQFENVSIAGLAHIDAPHRIPSAELGQQLSPTLMRLGLHPDMLEHLSGIVARRFWDVDTQPSQVAARAGELAIQDAGIDKRQIGLIINTSVCKDYIEPSTASLVHGLLGLPPDCQNFDIGNACLAFVNAMQVAGLMIERRMIDYALIVDGEGSRFITEQTVQRLQNPGTDMQTLRDNFAALTLGSGAAAMVLGHSDLVPDGHRLVSGVTQAASQHNRLCLGQPDEMITDAHGLLVAGLELVGQTFPKFFEQTQTTVHDIDHLVIHQVSMTHTNRFIDLIEADSDKVYRVYPEYGNIGPAGIPIVLSKTVQEGNLSRGDWVVLGGIGSGLNCSVMGISW